VSNALLPRTHPAQRGRGIGTTLTQWGEQRVTEYLTLAPESARVTVECSNVATHEAGAHLLSDLGYQHVRSGYEMKIAMSSPPPPPTWPDGITIRSMVAAQEEAAVFRALEECFQDHWGHVEKPFDESFAQWLHFIRNVPDYDPTFVFLAVAGDEIAGVALCFPKDNEYPDMAWVQSLGVRRPWRRQGLALALLHHLFGASYRRGITKVGLGVDTESLTGATRLYEKAGMQIYRQWDTYEKELRPGEDLVTRQVVAG
jgi:ribosomal protein S18 acetylase RimI-like enzyme